MASPGDTQALALVKPRTRTGGRQWVAVAWGAIGVVGIMVIWELYKFLGPAEGVIVGAVAGETGSGVMILPRTHDRAMPHIWDMVARLFQSASGGNTPPLIVPVLTGVAPILTPIAASGLVLIMVLAIGYHLRFREYKFIPINLVLLVLPLFVAITRFAGVGA